MRKSDDGVSCWIVRFACVSCMIALLMAFAGARVSLAFAEEGDESLNALELVADEGESIDEVSPLMVVPEDEAEVDEALGAPLEVVDVLDDSLTAVEEVEALKATTYRIAPIMYANYNAAYNSLEELNYYNIGGHRYYWDTSAETFAIRSAFEYALAISNNSSGYAVRPDGSTFDGSMKSAIGGGMTKGHVYLFRLDQDAYGSDLGYWMASALNSSDIKTRGTGMTRYGAGVVRYDNYNYCAVAICDGTSSSTSHYSSGSGQATRDISVRDGKINFAISCSTTMKLIPDQSTTFQVFFKGTYGNIPIYANGLSWSSSDPSVASLRIGSSSSDLMANSKITIYANKSGVATITGKHAGTGKTIKIKVLVNAIDWKRIAGKGRYDTMESIVKEGWSQTGGTVVVATGESYKDALAASYLAGVFQAPIVLVNGKSTTLNQQAYRQLNRLQPSQVFVIGGPAAITLPVFQQIKNTVGFEPVRIWGNNSSLTSAEILRYLNKNYVFTSSSGGYYAGEQWHNHYAIVVTNKSFKDALSIAPYAYHKRMPVLLANNGKFLTDDVLNVMSNTGVEYVLIAGGKKAVDPYVERQLNARGITVVKRFAGSDAVHTSRLIANWALQDSEFSANYMGYATSQNFPDALAGAALCGYKGSVLLLCDDKKPGKTDYNISFANEHRSEIQTGYVFGGTGAFSKKLYNRLPQTR